MMFRGCKSHSIRVLACFDLVNSGEGARGERLHGGQEDGDEADCHIGQGEENQHHQHHAVGRQQAEKRTSHDLSNVGHMISKHWSHDF